MADLSPSTPCPTFATYAAEWRRFVCLTIAPTTLSSYDYFLTKILPAFGDRPLDSITARELRAFAAELGRARRKGPPALRPGTIRQVLGLTKRIFDAAIQDEVLGRNPATGLSRPFARGIGKGLPFPAERFAEVMERVRRRHGHVADLLLFTSRAMVRVGEACGLQWTDCNLTQGQAVIRRSWDWQLRPTTKSRKSRIVVLDEDVVAMLQRRFDDDFADDLWVFPSPTRRDQPMSRSHVEGVMRDAVKEVGLPGGNGYTPHALRHGGATLLTEAEVDIRWLQQQLGHASVQITHDLYARTARLKPPTNLAAIFRAAHRKAPRPAAAVSDDRSRRRRQRA